MDQWRSRTRRLAGAVGVAACGLLASACDRGPTAPPQPANTVQVPAPTPPAGFGHIKGQVIDALLRALPEATVEVLDGPDTGTKAVSNSKGEFELVVSSPFQAVKIRASKEGYQPLTSNATSAPAGSFSSVIVRLSGSESYDALTAGEYTLTIAFDMARARSTIADAPCPAFPDDLTSRNYEVSVAASPAGVRTVGITRLPAAPWFAFPLFVADDRVVLDFGDDGINEDIPGFRFLSVWAWVPPSNPSVMSIGSSILFPVAAEFRYCQLKGPRGIYNDCSQVPPYERLAYHSCVSDDAVMRFTRR